ncbi:hypothetical protein KC19_2G112400 [Ceratodon purpureus]|uniref:Uncharacterized protein n=1 Tax=Ceratodon purpureus TaxID=3225 RepID=A0A8T0ISN1_CERPU|nr:hypothetical protein KC19_2G112400 [Ceratodon purpureus]
MTTALVVVPLGDVLRWLPWKFIATAGGAELCRCFDRNTRCFGPSPMRVTTRTGMVMMMDHF